MILTVIIPLSNNVRIEEKNENRTIWKQKQFEYKIEKNEHKIKLQKNNELVSKR
jgi:hypothetical protein